MSGTVVLMPHAHVLYDGLVLALKPIEVCRSVQCADKQPPDGLGSLMKTGGVGWEFAWHPIHHGVAECIQCHAWHQVYHWRYDERDPLLDHWLEPSVHTGWSKYEDVGIYVPKSRAPHTKYLYVFAQLIDTRPEHWPQGKVLVESAP